MRRRNNPLSSSIGEQGKSPSSSFAVAGPFPQTGRACLRSAAAGIPSLAVWVPREMQGEKVGFDALEDGYILRP
jgi:hypothetical protein